MHDSALQSRHGGLRAVADVEAAENNIDVPFDRRLADAQNFTDLPIAVALDDQLQHFQFARAQLRMRRAFRQTLGNRGGNVLQAGVNRADRVDQFVVRHALQNVSVRASLERFVNVLVAVVSCENYKVKLRICLANGANRFHAAQAREAQIHQHDIGRLLGAYRAGLLPRPRLSNHDHIRLQTDDRSQPEANHRVIVYEDDANCCLIRHVCLCLFRSAANPSVTRYFGPEWQPAKTAAVTNNDVRSNPRNINLSWVRSTT